jgi:hypothetical protein
MFGSRPLRLVRLLVAVPACWAAGFANAAMAEDVWSSLATVSASAPLASGRVCYSDGRDIACDVNAPTLASLTAPLTLGLDDLTDVTASVSTYSIFGGYRAGGTGTSTVTNTTAFGYQALRANTNGYGNSAFGWSALDRNTTGYLNSAVGAASLFANTTGSRNNAFGNAALQNNIDGSLNVVVGHVAGYGAANAKIDQLVAIGALAGYALTSSTGNILIGYQAGDAITSGNYNIVIGHNVDPFSNTGSNQLNIGNTIYGDLGLKRVGIGVTSPTDSLQISGTGSFSSRLGVGAFSTNPSYTFHLNSSADNDWAYFNMGRSVNSGMGLWLNDRNSAGPSPYIRVTGRRSDGNTSGAFSGQLVLEGIREDGAVLSGKTLGRLVFGGNNDSAGTLGWAASLAGLADGNFTDPTNMPTALVFATGSVSTSPTSTVGGPSIGTERMRITSAGRVGVGLSNPTTTLHVSGSFMVTAADSGCTTDTIGTMRVNPTTKRLQLCLDR